MPIPRLAKMMHLNIPAVGSRRQILAVLAAVILCGDSPREVAANQPVADSATIVVRGRVWTADSKQPHAEAVAVRGDRIVAVGSREEIEPLIGNDTEVFDAGEGLVVPGLIDSHIHLIDGGLQLTRVQLRDANSREEFARRLGEFAKQEKPGAWITGGEWDHTVWGGELPSRDWIDKVTPDNPVWVHRLDGHMALANTAAMRAAGIDDDVEDVDGGEIVRDRRGRPTGVFKDNAMGLIDDEVPNLSTAQQLGGTVAAMNYLAERGVTAVHHMGTWPHVDVFRLARRRGLLKTRIYACTPLAAWKRLKEEVRDRGRGDDWLRIGGLKGFVDGSLGSHTAAMQRPFSDEPDDRGLLVNTAEDLEEWATKADRAGLQVVVHAIGDRANRLQLDVFERVAKNNGPRDRRFRIEHAQHIAPEDIPRFAELGVIPSMQPYHTIDDGRWAQEVIGRKRSETSYAFRSLLDAGARLAFGSDWSVAPPTPLEGIYAAVTRRTLDGKHPKGWMPRQKISVEEALRAYTIDAAYAGFSESSLGSLQVGKLADIVVDDRDLFKQPAGKLNEARVQTTIVGGKVIFRRDEQPKDAELGLIPAVEPAAATRTFVMPPGFRIEQVAAEPLVRDPIAMEFDENGFAYVIELPPYNAHARPGPRPPGSICRLEDSDGDGRFDKRTTFVEDLKYATGLFCYDGGLFVGDPPDLLFLRDTDGDGKADQREVVMTGFGAAPAGESQLNSFRWGLDNRIHISTGADGGELRPADETDDPPRNVRNRNVLLDPRTRTFELSGGGGQHGMSFDDWGRMLVCENSAPIQTIVYDDRYLERNPLMSAPSAVVSLGPGAGYTKLVRKSPAETWRLVRSRILEEGLKVTDTYEWDRIVGVFTSATGITVYRGDAWPKEFSGNVFVGEVVNNLIYRARLNPAGVTVASEHADGESGFMASTDTWFRPVQFAHGPDGNLYVLDMYRQLIEGVQWVPPEVLARMDPTAGADRGRIYRIVPQDFKPQPPVSLGEMSTESLVAVLAHPNSWHRETAARLLYERNDRVAVEPLRKLTSDSEFAQGRLHAMYALEGLQALEAADVLARLGDKHPGMRQHALRLAEQFAGDSKEIQHKLVRMTADADVPVRYQLAFSLGSLPADVRESVLLALLKQDGADTWFRMALQTSLAKGAAKLFQTLLNDDKLQQSKHGQEFLAALASQVGRGNDPDELRLVVAAMDERAGAGDGGEALVKSLVVALLGDGSKTSADRLMSESQGGVREIVLNMLATARATALDADKASPERVEAIEILSWGDFAQERPAFEELLEPQQPQPVQDAVLHVLGHFSDSAVAGLLLAKWPVLTPSLRKSAAELLFTREEWTESLISAVEQHEVAAADIDPARVTLLQSHPAGRIRKRAAKVFSESNLGRRTDVVAEYQQALKMDGNADRGREVFVKTCSACHKLEDVGTSIGADLNAIRQRGLDAVLLNILDPNREIRSEFLSYVVVTNDGRIITGMITEETPNNLTIRQADGTTAAISRTDIEEMKSTGVSYMPEGLEKEVDLQAMADLLAYLGSID